MIRNKKIVLIVIGVVLLITMVVIGLHGKSTPKNTNYTESTTKEPERGGLNVVTINNTEQLAQILLSEQFTTVKLQLSDYIQSTIGNTVPSASIIGDPVINDNGLIVIRVQTDNPQKQFTATIDRLTYFNKVVFSVPADNYTVTTNAFASN